MEPLDITNDAEILDTNSSGILDLTDSGALDITDNADVLDIGNPEG